MRIQTTLAGAMALVLTACGNPAPRVSGAAGAAHASGKDYCDLSNRSSLFLIDRTTVLDASDKATILESLGTVVDGLQTGDRIVIATIEDHYSGTRLETNACKPGCAPASGAMDAVAGSCSTMKAKQDERAFNLSLAKSIRPLLDTAEEKPGSDIIRTIAQWTKAPPGDEAFTDVYIFSDMLENSELFKWSAFRAMSLDQAMSRVDELDLVPETRSARVRIVGFGRGHGADRPPLPPETDATLRKFWTAYFDAGGGQASFEGAIRD